MGTCASHLPGDGFLTDANRGLDARGLSRSWLSLAGLDEARLLPRARAARSALVTGS